MRNPELMALGVIDPNHEYDFPKFPRHLDCGTFTYSYKDRSMSVATTFVRPIRDQIVVRRLEADEKTPGGIVLPDAAKERPQRGTVFAVGGGTFTQNGQRIPLEVKEGDEIVFGKFSGTTIEVEGEEFVVMREADVLAIVRRED